MDITKTRKPVPDVECLKYHGTSEKPDIKIFISHRIDLDSKTIDKSLYIPVRCGAMYDERKNITMLGDDTGDNISEKRMTFNELTVQYWAWKNIKADYYGFFHYRRYLNFTENLYEADDGGRACEAKNPDEVIGKYGWDEDTIERVVSDNDVVIAQKSDCKKWPNGGYSSLIEQYASSFPYMHDKAEDIDIILEILNDCCPEYYQFGHKVFHGSVASYCNLFVMKKELFFKYCDWLFMVLSEFEKRKDTSNYNAHAQRSPAFLSERLLNVFLMREMHINKELKVKELQMVYFLNAQVIEKKIAPVFQKDAALIVTSSSDYYVPIAAVWLQSLIDNSKPEHKYDIVLLQVGISQNNQQQLQSMLKNYPNISLRFFDVKIFLEGLAWNNWNHTNALTYARFLIPELFQDYKKAVWSDGDIVFKRDPFDLYSEDVSGYFLAAAMDVRVNGMLGYPSYPQKKDSTEILKLKNPYLYFQAGIIVLNLDEFRTHFTISFLLQEARRTDLRWCDQDILNMQCQGRVKFLQLQWNMTVPAHIPLETYAPAELERQWKLAQKDPWAIHYAGDRMPISVPDVEYAGDWWICARKTPYYEILLARMIENTKLGNYLLKSEHPITPLQQASPAAPQPPYVSGIRKWADRYMPKGSKRRAIAKKILPKGSMRWNLLKKIYNTFKGIK